MGSVTVSVEELAKIDKGALTLISNRGTIEILSLFCCSQKKVRFTELSRFFKHISTKTLASRLKELQEEGILKRTAYNEIPPRVEYSMTEKGQSLAIAVGPLVEWMVQWTKPEKPPKEKAKAKMTSSCSECQPTQITSGNPTTGQK